MKGLFTLIVISLLVSFSSPSQNLEKVISETDVAWLQQFINKKAVENKIQNAKVEAWCRKNNFPRKQVLPDGRLVEIVEIDRNGTPRFRSGFNTDAAITISTDKIQNGGLPDYNLSGRGIYAGIWDEGAAMNSHQELLGKIQVMDGSSPNYHGTHVAGTMIANGVVPSARGMASEGELDSYYWDFDRDSMAAAAARGMLVSNHSYGFNGGWVFVNGDWYYLGDTTISQVDDFRFGRYDTWSRDYDNIIFHAPYYTAVWAAGNQKQGGGPGPGQPFFQYNFTSGGWLVSTSYRMPNGPYDCLVSERCAKNVIVVGGVDAILGGYLDSSSVDLYPASSSGPLDDGRIKPDITANGIDVYSCTNANNSSYGFANGTSMAAPGVSGTIMLLQEHYSNLNQGNYLRSESIHALIIHSANEAGSSPGPDYEFGWGLMNGEGAASILSQDSITNIIEETSITEFGMNSFQVYTDGSEPLKATIAWHEPGSDTVPFALDDPTPMLINDLDLRIISPLDTFYPWVLDRLNPANPATKGDNLVDNIEQVEIISPVAGMYTIEVSHKDSLLSGMQTYSIIVTGIQTGDTLVHCRPLVKFNAQNGQFTDGSGSSNYKNLQDCAWLIQPHSGPIELSFESLDLENNADMIRVYAGSDNTGTMLGTVTGNSIPSPITTSGNSMYIEFISDNNDNSNSGFLATYNSACYGWQEPVVGFSAVVWPVDTCQRRVRFNNLSTVYDSLVWDYGDGTIVNLDTQTHDYYYSNGGIYSVNLIGYGGRNCFGIQVDTFSMDVQVGCPLGVGDDIHQLELKVYPNPARDLLNISGNWTSNPTIEVYDLFGKEYQVDYWDNGQEIRLETSPLSKGLYLIRVSDGRNNFTEKVMIE